MLWGLSKDYEVSTKPGMHNSNGPAGRNGILGSGRGPDSGFPPPPEIF